MGSGHDPEELRQKYIEKGCEVKVHPANYRSVHYLIKSQPTKKLFITELQVRTIFEEGWSEIDHRIRYPYETENLLLSQLLAILNRLAGSADEMGSYVTLLKNELGNYTQLIRQTVNDRNRIEVELSNAIKRLTISAEEKQDLQRKLDELSKKEPSTSDLIKPFRFSVLSGLNLDEISRQSLLSAFTAYSNISDPRKERTEDLSDKTPERKLRSRSTSSNDQSNSKIRKKTYVRRKRAANRNQNDNEKENEQD